MRYQVKDLIFYEVKDDGTVVEQSMAALGWSLGHIVFLHGNEDDEHCFWLASNHTGLTEGEHAIATPVPGVPLNEDEVKNRTNTLVGLIRDNACHVFASYNVGKGIEFIQKDETQKR